MKEIVLNFNSTFTQMGETETIEFDNPGKIDFNKRFTKLHFYDNDEVETTIRLSAKTVLIIKDGYELHLKFGEKVDNYFETEQGYLSLTTYLQEYKFEPNHESFSGSVSLKYTLSMAEVDGGNFNISIDYKGA